MNKGRWTCKGYMVEGSQFTDANGHLRAAELAAYQSSWHSQVNVQDIIMMALHGIIVFVLWHGLDAQQKLDCSSDLCGDPSQWLRVPAMACCRHSSKMHEAVTQADHTSGPSRKIPKFLLPSRPSPLPHTGHSAADASYIILQRLNTRLRNGPRTHRFCGSTSHGL